MGRMALSNVPPIRRRQRALSSIRWYLDKHGDVARLGRAMGRLRGGILAVLHSRLEGSGANALGKGSCKSR